MTRIYDRVLVCIFLRDQLVHMVVWPSRTLFGLLDFWVFQFRSQLVLPLVAVSSLLLTLKVKMIVKIFLPISAVSKEWTVSYRIGRDEHPTVEGQGLGEVGSGQGQAEVGPQLQREAQGEVLSSPGGNECQTTVEQIFLQFTVLPIYYSFINKYTLFFKWNYCSVDTFAKENVSSSSYIPAAKKL